MTLEEKVAQLRSMRAGEGGLTEDVLNDSAKMDELFGHGLGMLNPEFDAPLEQTIEQRNRLQQYLTTKTRRGIPVLFLDEAHHGLLAPEVDVFPHAIGLACSWDPALVEEVYGFIAAQVRSRGGHMVLAPVVDVARDPRWGRTGETFGEDPYLCGVLGSAAVRGFQGASDGTIAPGHVAATLKHFAGHGESQGGINQGPANCAPRVLRECHMEPFRLCIERTRPAAMMASYCEVDGVPCHANAWLLQQVLRREWQFDGVVVSDWFGIDQLWNKHTVELTAKTAALRAFRAGVTVDLPHGVNYAHLVALVREGAIREAELDTTVARVLRLKFELGLFEERATDVQGARALTGTAAGRDLALKAASRSMVLLKNDNALLPIRRGQYRVIAVIGPCAAVNYLGDYSGIPVRNISLLEGLKRKVGTACDILYAQGVVLTQNGDSVSRVNYQFKTRAEFPSPLENERLIADVLSVAKRADLIILALGENEQLSREAGDPGRFGDMCTLDLQSGQEELMEAVADTGKPVVVYLMHARPLSIPWVGRVSAVIDGWFAGQEAGTAFADILFGDTNPSGKLVISYPRSVGHLPAYYNHKPSARTFEYVTSSSTPLFPFGYGLSYTTFAYSLLRASSAVMQRHERVKVEVDVTNTGSVPGDEVVQLYIHQRVSSVTRPVKELKDFARIHLEPGETKTVQFTIDAGKLAFWTADMTYEVEPGVFDIMIGRSSADVQTLELTVRE